MYLFIIKLQSSRNENILFQVIIGVEKGLGAAVVFRKVSQNLDSDKLKSSYPK